MNASRSVGFLPRRRSIPGVTRWPPGPVIWRVSKRRRFGLGQCLGGPGGQSSSGWAGRMLHPCRVSPGRLIKLRTSRCGSPLVRAGGATGRVFRRCRSAGQSLTVFRTVESWGDPPPTRPGGCSDACDMRACSRATWSGTAALSAASSRLVEGTAGGEGDISSRRSKSGPQCRLVTGLCYRTSCLSAVVRVSARGADRSEDVTVARGPTADRHGNELKM